MFHIYFRAAVPNLGTRTPHGYVENLKGYARLGIISLRRGLRISIKQLTNAH